MVFLVGVSKGVHHRGKRPVVIRTGTRGVALGLRVPARVAALKAASSTVVFVVVAGAVVANG